MTKFKIGNKVRATRGARPDINGRQSYREGDIGVIAGIYGEVLNNQTHIEVIINRYQITFMNADDYFPFVRINSVPEATEADEKFIKEFY